MPEVYGIPLLDIALRLVMAIGVGSAIGIEREYKGRPAGLRTHVLVCVGACVLALLECCLIHDIVELGSEVNAVGFNIGRICAQIVSGIGFLGAGTIISSKRKINGLTTAASLWNVACLGMASGYGYYLVAGAGGFFVLAVLIMMQRIIRLNTLKKVEIKFIHRIETLEFINTFFEENKIKVLDVDFRVENTKPNNIYTNIYELHLPKGFNYKDIVQHLSEFTNVQSIHTMNV